MTRGVVLRDAGNPLSVQTMTETYSVNGRESSMTYDAATRTIETTSPSGAVASTTPQGSTTSARP